SWAAVHPRRRLRQHRVSVRERQLGVAYVPADTGDMTRVSLALLALVGCDRVFGLHPTDAPGANTVVGTYELRRIVDGPDGTPIVQHEIVPSSRLAFAATRDD